MLDDNALLRAFKRGAKEALRNVYEFYLNDVVRMVRIGFSSGKARVKPQYDRGEQLDQAHDIFVKAFKEKARYSYDGLRPYKPYLLRIGKNTVIDRLRKLRPEVSFEEHHSPPGDAPMREEEIHFQKLKEATQNFLKEQDDELKHFVVYRFEEGLSQADVAKKMNISRRRVRTLESRAQQALLEHLNALGLVDDLGSKEIDAAQRPKSKDVA